MHILVGINNNIYEWQATLEISLDRPRLPLPYSFGAAFINRGHKISAIDVCSLADKNTSGGPFEKIFHIKDIMSAMKCVDIVSFWGGLAVKAILKQPFLPRPQRRVLLNSYVWKPKSFPTFNNKKKDIATRLLARFAKGVVVMTHEQAEKAREDLSGSIPVINFRCGVDISFYCSASSYESVPVSHRRMVDKILRKPFIIMPGDELRINSDALKMIERSEMLLVRISQYSDKSRTDLLTQEIAKKNLSDRVIILERISYPFMRFLLHNAAAYAGLVDSTWQPAGWTVACEALSSGVPVVLYEGLVSRELKRIGAQTAILRSVPMRDTKTFQIALEDFVSRNHKAKYSQEARTFAINNLNLEFTGNMFAQQIENVFNRYI